MSEQGLQVYNNDETRLTSEKIVEMIELVTDGLTSPHTIRAYEQALKEFLTWYIDNNKPGLTKAVVNEYKAHLLKSEKQYSTATINQKLSAIRKLAQEASDNAYINEQHANGISRVTGIKKRGVRSGNWLTQEQTEKLLNTPEVSTLQGKRDRAILALLIFCWLRRSEMAKLTMEHIQQREGRWVIVDMIGKGNRTRTITVHPTAKYLLDDWTQAVGITSGLLFRAINKWDNLAGERDIRKDKKADGFLTDQAIADMVKKYGAKCGFPKLAPHDLRRTGARLAYDAGGSIEQIQLQLGHANLKTTQDYLNIKLDYRDAPGDKIRLKIKMI